MNDGVLGLFVGLEWPNEMIECTFSKSHNYGFQRIIGTSGNSTSWTQLCYASYIATSLHRYIATSLHRYIATSLHRYIASSILWPVHDVAV
jgi:hypothetical protein